ncbi:MAG: hypothetical protein AB1449_14955 [Chloroflexota bacterium]
MGRSILPGGHKRHPIGHWPWWKILLRYATGAAGFGIVIAAVPPTFSPPGVRLGLLLGGACLVVYIWNWVAYNWWSRISEGAAFSLILLGMGARGLAFALPDPGVWAPPLVAGYLLAWALPALAPRLSHFLYWEQFAPHTRVGRGCLAISLAVGGSAGALGASIGMFSSRFDEASVVAFLMGILGSLLSIVLAFATSWELWPSRPWASKEQEAPPADQPE